MSCGPRCTEQHTYDGVCELAPKPTDLRQALPTRVHTYAELMRAFVPVPLLVKAQQRRVSTLVERIQADMDAYRARTS